MRGGGIFAVVLLPGWMFAESRRESLVGFPQSRRTVIL